MPAIDPSPVCVPVTGPAAPSLGGRPALKLGRTARIWQGTQIGRWPRSGSVCATCSAGIDCETAQGDSKPISEAARRPNEWCGRKDSPPLAKANGFRGVTEGVLTHQGERQRDLVRKKGLEPSRCCHRQPLKLAKLLS